MSQLEDEISASLAEQMQKTMDFEVLCGLFIPFGWTRIETNLVACKEAEWTEITGWVSSNFTGQYRENCGVWLIENSKDATMFMLKWA